MTQSSGPATRIILRLKGNLRKLAEGKPCQIRLVGICNRRDDTTVLCHRRGSATGGGLGLKPHDIFGAWGCSACHAYVDTHHDDATQVAFDEGVFRTQQKYLDMGVLVYV
jgi:hypothetical protein